MPPVKSIIACVLAAAIPLIAAAAFTFVDAAQSTAMAGQPIAVIASFAPAQGAYGTIKGKLVWGGSTIPKPDQLKADKDPNVCAVKPLFDRGLEIDPQTKGIANAFAYINTPKGKNAEAEKELISKEPKVTIDQKNCEFLPYSTAIHKDQTLIFKSSDAIGHNAHYQGFTNNRNVALGPNGQTESKLVAEKRPLALTCDIHPWMKGNIMVFDHPFFAVTAPDGSFEIKGVPAGAQNLVVWQVKTGYVTAGAARGMPVNVKAGEVTDVGNITLDPAKVKK
jgi:hypothetical protein